MVGQSTSGETGNPIVVSCLEIDPPRIVVQGNDTGSTTPFSEKRVVTVPGSDIEDTPPAEIGK